MGLVLTRKKGQAIVIDGPATIRVVAGTAKILVTADPATKIDREEVAERKRKEKSA